MIQTTTHIAEGLALLITQYKNKPNLTAILTAYLTQVQELEDTFFDILAILGDVDSQVGEQLDLIGRIVGQEREGRTDAVYIQWIHARVLVNRSSGLVDELLRILELVAPNNARSYSEFYPASFLLELLGAFTDDPEAVAAILGEARAAGVNGQLEYSLRALAGTFTFSTGDTEEASTTQGWTGDVKEGSVTDHVDNGDFANWTADDPDDWTVTGETGGTLEVSEVGSGEAHGGAGTGACNFFDSTGGSPLSMLQALPTALVIGEQYVLELDITVLNSGSLFVTVAGLTSQQPATVGNHRFEFTATETNPDLSLIKGPGNADLTIDNVGIIPANGAFADALET